MNNQNLRKHFIESLYDTLGGVVSPTPYVEITEGDRVDIKYLDGKGRLPNPNSTEITTLDLDVASLFFDDFRVLKEGVTGVGKTYGSDAILNAVFGPNGHYTIRLGGGLLGMSALEPFTKTELENGIPKQRIDPDKLQRYGGLFIDEINRGDTQEVFQVVDGVIHVNGDTGYIRIPIPGTDRYKKVAIFAAMNPADADHSSALELDIAGENRFLKFKFPNGVAEAASSQLDKREYLDLHKRFWDQFSERTGLKGDWRELYPLVTDPEAVRMELDGETREFIDVALGYVGEDPVGTYRRNKELIESGGYSPRFSVAEGNDTTRVRDAQKNLKHGFVRRDLQKIQDLSRLLGFVKSMKNGSYDPSVSLNDAAASIGIVLESKKVTGSESGPLLALVNDALHAYKGLREGYDYPSFGLREAVWQAAMHSPDFETYQNTLRKSIDALNTQSAGVASATLRSRLVADLVVLEHFGQMHEDAVTKALKKRGTKSHEDFKALYEANKSQASVYEHRLGSIVR
jgi:hypothetical protein